MNLRSVLLGLTILPVVALACLNDRDTLAFEKRNVDALASVTNEANSDQRAAAVKKLFCGQLAAGLTDFRRVTTRCGLTV